MASLPAQTFGAFAFLVWFVVASAEIGSAPDPFALDNQVMGDPKVFCGEDGVKFEIETTQPFTGKIYARNEYYRDTCRSNFDELPTNVKFTKGGEFQLNFNQCGVKRERMITPVRGMSYSVTMMVQFHDTFVTKSDRAYDVRCFYKERSVTVDAGSIEVSQLATDIINIDHPLPQCTYSIRHKSAHGPPATFARVGDPVVHVFSCDNDAGTYNILVRDCKVSDGKGNEKRLIDERGCAMDPNLISNPEYGNVNLAAYATATVFKWPDEAAVYFSCQMTLCMKVDDECMQSTPPRCDADRNESIPRSRRRRSTNNNSTELSDDDSASLLESMSSADNHNTMKLDLQVNKLLVLDADQVIDPILDRVPPTAETVGEDGKFDSSSLGEIVRFSTSLDGQPVLVGEQVHQQIIPTLVEPPSINQHMMIIPTFAQPRKDSTTQPLTNSARSPPLSPPTTTTMTTTSTTTTAATTTQTQPTPQPTTTSYTTSTTPSTTTTTVRQPETTLQAQEYLDLPTKAPRTSTQPVTLLRNEPKMQRLEFDDNQVLNVPSKSYVPNKQVDWSGVATHPSLSNMGVDKATLESLTRILDSKLAGTSMAHLVDEVMLRMHKEVQGGTKDSFTSKDSPSKDVLSKWEKLEELKARTEKACYGFEYVIGFVIMMGLFVLALTVVTGRLMFPYIKQHWAKYRKQWQVSRQPQTSSFNLSYSAPTPPPDYVPITNSRLNVRQFPLSTAPSTVTDATSFQVYGSSCYLTPAPSISHH